MRWVNTIKYGLIKPGNKLRDWPSLSFKHFTAELSKAKIKLNGENKEEWLERFTRLGSQIKDINQRIKVKEHDLNIRVFALYGLNEEEIKFINQIPHDG